MKKELSPRQQVAARNMNALATLVTRASQHLNDQQQSALLDVELDCNDIMITIRHEPVDGVTRTTIYTATLEA